MRAVSAASEVFNTMMKRHLLLPGLAVLLALLLSGCTASLVNDPSQGQATLALHTPVLSPTPTAPPATIGAYASNLSPGLSDTVTIYVIFHLNGKPVGGATVSLYFHAYAPNGGGGPIDQLNNQAGTRQTADDGWAAFQVTYTALPAQVQVLIDVTVSYQGQTYVKKPPAFFTPIQGSPTPSQPPGG
jgi:hypothetical protein